MFAKLAAMNNPLLNTPEGSAAEESMVDAFIQQRGDRDLRKRYARLLEREHNVVRPMSTPRRRYAWVASIAAGLALLIGALTWWNQPSKYEVLLAGHLNVEDYYLPNFRGAVAPVDNQLTTEEGQLLLLFGAKRFDEVIVQAQVAQSPTAQFYLALALIEQQRYEEGRSLMQQLATHPDYGNEARWYDALLLLQLGELPAGIEKLADYPPSATGYYSRAQELLQQLREQ